MADEIDKYKEGDQEPNGNHDHKIDLKKITTILNDPEATEEQKVEILRIFSYTVLQESYFSGPIPPPEILKGYNGLFNNGAERIVAMAENQSNHRMQLEKDVVKSQLMQSGRGQIFGFIIGLFGLILAAGLALMGQTVVAVAMVSTTLIGLVAVFVIGKRIKDKDLENKNK